MKKRPAKFGTQRDPGFPPKKASKNRGMYKRGPQHPDNLHGDPFGAKNGGGAKV